ncbi:hypothetical protein [Plesiomonas shigelloides]|uniref:hypothetical protein n=1 Tax=Plesiomonas shigelloides TaxID=703 RepID=UPI000579D56C|nr:hypothetical protein [Plesiomonas shigelloides]
MAKHDWTVLQDEFLAAHRHDGITIQAWCKLKGLNYQSARRYLKLRNSTAQLNTHAQKNAQKSAQFSPSAQFDDQRKNRGSPDGAKDTAHRASGAVQGRAAQSLKTKPNSVNERDTHGHFVVGNASSQGNKGNRHPPNAFTQGNHVACKHGGYAKYLDADNLDELFDDASTMRLEDELRFTRARSLVLTKNLTRIYQDMATADDPIMRVKLYALYLKAEQALERNIARIESLHRTMSGIRVNNIQEQRYAEDVERIREAKRKLRAEADNIERNAGTTDTPVDEIVEGIRNSDSGGLMPCP